MFPHGVTVTRLRAQLVYDGYQGGSGRRDWANPDRLSIPGCGLAPTLIDEDRQYGAETVPEGWTLYAPTGADIAAVDRVETPHGVFAVEGEPSPWEHPMTGWKPGTVVKLRKVEG